MLFYSLKKSLDAADGNGRLHLMPLDRYAIFSATLLLQLHATPSLILILSLMKSHHIGDSTIFSMMHTISSIGTREAAGMELKCSCGNKVHLKDQGHYEILLPETVRATHL